MGNTAISKTGLGYVGRVRVSGRSRRQSESPLVVSDSFATAPMSPEASSLALSCDLPSSVKICPMRSASPLLAFHTCESALKTPLNTLK